MRQKHLLIPTLRDDPSDAETNSHRFMVRAGLIRQLAAGVYSYLPLGYRVLRNVERIIREEMDAAGATELLLPALHPSELWKESGRWEQYGDELMRLSDRQGRAFALGATHEEAITSLVRDEVKSYKKLPMTLYQLQTKFRDERRPRYGLLRGREFLMKDAYSFDATDDGLDRSYRSMYDAYSAIFDRCGIRYLAVEADSGSIGGTDTHEFVALSGIGEDTIAHCGECGYAANVELAQSVPPDAEPATAAGTDSGQTEDPAAGPQLTDTPDIRTIAQLTAYLSIRPAQIIKSVALLVDGKPVVALVRGDRELNETKVKRLFGASNVTMMGEADIAAKLGSYPGYIGPVGLGPDVTIAADEQIRSMTAAVVGANEPDRHLTGVVPGRDFRIDASGDLCTAVPGDLCPNCRKPLLLDKGIEVGHVFKLGTKYSEPMRATFLDDTGKPRPFQMGCYGIGVSRLLAAIAEQHHDEAGIVWPSSVAPFHVHLIVASSRDDTQTALAEKLYDELRRAGIDVLLDDRDERAGVKFADSDLLGIPIRVTVGKRAAEGVVECKRRRDSEAVQVETGNLTAYIRSLDV